MVQVRDTFKEWCSEDKKYIVHSWQYPKTYFIIIYVSNSWSQNNFWYRWRRVKFKKQCEEQTYQCVWICNVVPVDLPAWRHMESTQHPPCLHHHLLSSFWTLGRVRYYKDRFRAFLETCSVWDVRSWINRLFLMDRSICCRSSWILQFFSVMTALSPWMWVFCSMT